MKWRNEKEQTVTNPIPAQRWICASCDAEAVLFAQGTTYCRPCFKRRSMTGELI